MPTTTSIAVGGSPMDIYIDAPERTRPGPAILLMYHRTGLDEFTKTQAARLAANGYLVAVPDVSHRLSRDIAMPDRKQYFKDSQVVADMAATVDYMVGRPDVAAGAVAIMGHCMGGRMTMLGAAALPRFCAAVIYYGGGGHLSWGEEGVTPLDRLGEIKCPVIGYFGDKDTNPTPEQVDTIDAAMSRHQVPHEFHRYPDAGHGFVQRTSGTPGELAAAADSWAKTMVFLAQHCRM